MFSVSLWQRSIDLGPFNFRLKQILNCECKPHLGVIQKEKSFMQLLALDKSWPPVFLQGLKEEGERGIYRMSDGKKEEFQEKSFSYFINAFCVSPDKGIAVALLKETRWKTCSLTKTHSVKRHFHQCSQQASNIKVLILTVVYEGIGDYDQIMLHCKMLNTRNEDFNQALYYILTL